MSRSSTSSILSLPDERFWREHEDRLLARDCHQLRRLAWQIIDGILTLNLCQIESLKPIKYREFDRFLTLAITGDVITKVITSGAIRSDPRLSAHASPL
jgi:hypothetical protein